MEEIKTPPQNPSLTFPISSAPFSFHPHNFQFLNVVQKSLCSNVDKFLNMVDVVRSQNALLDKVLSFSSYLQNCFQFQIRGRENVYCCSMLRNDKFAAILPGGDSVTGMVVANGIFNFLNIYNTLLIVRIVLTWFPTAPSVIVNPLSTICDPYLNVFRGLIPPLGGTLDLSPILAFLVLNAFTSTAAALPAELPSQANMSSSQRKWVQRLARNKTSKPDV